MTYNDNICDKIVESTFEPSASMGQYFLCNPSKINHLIDATDIQANDTVAKISAGIGSVARHIPPVRRLSLVELDERLAEILRNEFCKDAIGCVANNNFDILISNLPSYLTGDILNQLVNKTFRVAVMPVSQSDVLDGWCNVFGIDEIETNSGDDFYQPQPFASKVIRITPRTQ